MSDRSAFVPPATEIGRSALAAAEIHFLGSPRAYRRLMTRGVVLLLLTLGLYRFWLATDMRRFLWNHTEIAGNALEYSGTAAERLVGFVLGLALLAPICAGFVYAAVEFDVPVGLSGAIALGSLAWLWPYTRYRARRYLLSRTVFNGMRFLQTGAAWRYAFRALGWWIVVVLTLGLAYPWAQTSLERYKMRNSFHGDQPGWFKASPLGLFLRGFPLWLAIAGPTLAGLYPALRDFNWDVLARSVTLGGGGLLARIAAGNPGIVNAMPVVKSAFVWTMAAAILLYPAFRAMVLRWRLSGIAFGELTVRSRLPTLRVYGVYLRFFWLTTVLAVLCGLFGAGMLTTMGYLLEQGQASRPVEAAAIAVLAFGLAMFGLAYYVGYQVTVGFALWRAVWQTLELTGVRAPDRVRAVGGEQAAPQDMRGG